MIVQHKGNPSILKPADEQKAHPTYWPMLRFCKVRSLFATPGANNGRIMKMQRIKSTHLLGVLMFLIANVANAQQPSMGIDLITFLTKTDPYCGGNYSGISLSGLTAEQLTTLCPRVPKTLVDDSSAELSLIPSNVVDWVLLELRSPARDATPTSDDALGSTIVARKPAFLLAKGRVVDAEDYVTQVAADSTALCDTAGVADDTNCPDVRFEITVNDTTHDVYLVVRHRNHLDIMSNEKLPPSSGIYTYDFSDAIDKIKGRTHTSKSGVYAMLSGDTDGSGSINESDYTSVVLPKIPTTRKYEDGDTNFDANINESDYTSTILTNTPSTGAVPN